MRKGQPHPSKGIRRPYTWKAGPDELRHKQYLIWLQQRNQANFRKEVWTLSFEEWLSLWKDKWHLRGRSKNSLCMSRRDPQGPWSIDNAIVVNRYEHIKKVRSERNVYSKLATKRKARQNAKSTRKTSN